MNLMTSPTIETVDLLDLKLLPAWVKEPAEARSYAHYSGEEDTGRRKAGHGPQRGRPIRRTSINRDEQASNIQGRQTTSRGIAKQNRQHDSLLARSQTSSLAES